MDPQGSNNLQGYSLRQTFWEPSGIPRNHEREQGDYIDGFLSMMLGNEGGHQSHHNGQDPPNNRPVINREEHLPGGEYFDYIFNYQDNILNPMETCDTMREHFPDYTFTPEEVYDALREDRIIEMNDIVGPEPSRHPRSENSTNVPLAVTVQNVEAILAQLVDAENNTESSETQSTDRKCSIVTKSNSEVVVMKAPISGKTVEIEIPTVKLDKLFEHLIKIGSKRVTEMNQGSKRTARGGISLSGITKLWTKLRSRPAVGCSS